MNAVLRGYKVSMLLFSMLVVCIRTADSFIGTASVLIVSLQQFFRRQQQQLKQRMSQSQLAAMKIDGYDDAFEIIDKCSVLGETCDELYDAVRHIDKNGYKIYPTIEEKEWLLKEGTQGSWKLQLATGGGKYTTFKQVPIFAFAMVDEQNFGNGVGLNEDTIILSLLGPHLFQPKKRQMIITIEDMFVPGGNSVTKFLPDFVKNGMGLGKQPEDYESRPPTFTFIGSSSKSLIARGGTGGIAIWTRLEKDVRPAAYGSTVTDE